MVKMTLGSSTSQGASASSISQQRVSAYEALIGSLQNFGGEEGLTGAAYDSAKNYATSILVPLLQGAILLSEGIGQAVPRLPQKYQAEVGGEDLDSAVLESEIAAYNSSLRSQHNLLRMLSSADEISPSAIQRVSQGITNTTKLRNDAMEKLQKLNAFANSSNSVFDGVVSDVEGAVQAGLAEIGSSFASFNGTFTSSSPSWAKSIKKEWKARQAILDDYNRVLKNWEKNGDVAEKDIEVLKRYIERYPERELPEGLKNKIQEYDQTKIVEFLGISWDEWNQWYDQVSKGYEGVSTSITFLKGKMYLNGMEIVKDAQGFAIPIKDGQVIPELVKNFKQYFNKNGLQLEFSQTTGNYRALSSVVYNHSGNQVTTPGRTLQQAIDIDLSKINYAFKPGGGINFKGIGDAFGSAGWNSIKNTWKDFSPKDWMKATKLEKTGKFLGAAGTVLTVFDSVNNNIDFSDGVQLQEGVNAGIDTTVSVLSSAGATATGAAIGSFFLPPLGTVVGAVAGMAINTAINTRFDGEKSPVEYAQSYAKNKLVSPLFGGG